MDELPKCNMPGCNSTAAYDTKTRMGPWGYLCESHYNRYGTAPSTKLEQRVKIAYKSDKIPTVHLPLTLDSIVDISCPHCGESRTVEPDANYTVTCDSCDNKFKVVSPI